MKAWIGNLQGNVSLWAFGTGAVLFKAWLWHFRFPDTAEISVLFGGLLVPVSQAAAVVNFVLGWLVAVYSLKNIQRILIHFFQPLELVDNPETKDFFKAPATTLVSLLFFGFILDLVSANVAVRVGSRYEIVALLPRGSDGFLFDESGARGERFTIPAGGAIRLALRGRGAREVLLLRDQYNLITLEAFALERSRGLLRASSPDFRVEATEESPLVAGEEKRGTPHRRGIFDFEVTGPLRYSFRRLNIAVRLARGDLMEGGFLRPGEEAPCPEQTPREYATRFFADLCRNRSELGRWTDRATYRNAGEATVANAIGNYGVEIHYLQGVLTLDGADPVYSREATKIFARESAP